MKRFIFGIDPAISGTDVTVFQVDDNGHIFYESEEEFKKRVAKEKAEKKESQQMFSHEVDKLFNLNFKADKRIEIYKPTENKVHTYKSTEKDAQLFNKHQVDFPEIMSDIAHPQTMYDITANYVKELRKNNNIEFTTIDENGDLRLLRKVFNDDKKIIFNCKTLKNGKRGVIYKEVDKNGNVEFKYRNLTRKEEFIYWLSKYRNIFKKKRHLELR